MTLIAGYADDDGKVHLMGERNVGGHIVPGRRLVHSKLWRISALDRDGRSVHMGLALSGNVATIQAWTEVEPPEVGMSGWENDWLYSWLNSYLDRVRECLNERNLMIDGGNSSPPHAAGWTAGFLAINGRLVALTEELAWEELAVGEVGVTGSCWEFFQGAVMAYRQDLPHINTVTAMAAAFRLCSERFTVGDLADHWVFAGRKPPVVVVRDGRAVGVNGGKHTQEGGL